MMAVEIEAIAHMALASLRSTMRSRPSFSICLLAALIPLTVCRAGPAEVPYPNTAFMENDAALKTEWYQQYLQVQSAKLPIADRPSAARKREYGHCDATKLYYDTLTSKEGTAPEWASVRNCAQFTRDYGVLMMLYANGKGVASDKSLAIKYACSLNSSQAEMAARVSHLMQRSPKANASDIDLCGDAISGYMQGICAAIHEHIQTKLRIARLTSATRTWTSSEQAALRNLQRALDIFSKHRARNETDLSGTARRALQLEAEASEREQFVQDIESYENGNAPHLTPVELAGLEARLSKIYDVIMYMQGLDALNMGTVRKSDVQKTQQSWQRYRDAWIRFGAVKYPQIDSASLAGQLTARRIKQLSETLGAGE
jgi:hypothetical protein